MAVKNIKKGDTVYIISGKDKGKKGKVLSVLSNEGKIIVEGINIVKKHVKPARELQQGGIIDQEAPFYGSKAMVFCSKCNKPTRIGRKFLKEGSKVRICKKCGEIIDK